LYIWVELPDGQV